MHWVIISEVPLDEKNGAGMRAILPYLKLSPVSHLSSLYLTDQSHQGASVPGVRYEAVSYLNRRGLRVPNIFFGTLLKLFTRFKRTDYFLVLPNSIRDVLMGLACRLFSPNVVVWVMDDFIETYAWKGPGFRWFCSVLFSILYRTAAMRIGVSQAMDDSYTQTYKKKADLILGRTLRQVLPPHTHSNRPRKKLRLVYIGSFINHYQQPIQVLKQVLSQPQKALENIEIELDLYGMNPPPPEWLMTGKIHYRGSLASEDLLSTLNQYDFGLIPYSFGVDTARMMSLSFPSKLIDYMGASLPVLTFAPPGLSFLKQLQSKNIGITCTSLSPESLLEILTQLLSCSQETYETWQKNAHEWAENEFLFDDARIKQVLFGSKTGDGNAKVGETI